MSLQPKNPPVLEMRHISKTFGGTHALNDVAFTAYAGEIHALMGENGAGKSTLMKVLAGAFTPDPGGEIIIAGQPIKITNPMQARRAGVSVIYQELALALNLSVAENIHLGRELTRGPWIDRRRMDADCRDVLEKLGANFAPQTVTSRLSMAERQIVEIARAIHADARILVMDEPTTALSSRETERLFELVAQLKSAGLAIVYISHRMGEVYQLADRVSVLRDGGYVGTLSGAEVDPEKIVYMMVGRDLSSFYKRAPVAGAHLETVLEVADLSDGRRVNGASLTVRKGELLGLAGLVGAGRSELARLIYGAETPASGRIVLDGKAVSFRSPKEAIRHGVVYLTEDRKGDGLLLDMSVGDNINLQVFGNDSIWGMWLDRKRADQRAANAISAFAIRVAGKAVPVGALSGGNQQKVLLSRLLETKPKVLILDEPTRGVDIGAKAEIYRIIDELVHAGVAVLVISSELPEVVGICDRVAVMREGRIVGEVGGESGQTISEENIMALAVGVNLKGRLQ
jgi:ribose transport system ATP-binding protein